MFSQLLDRVAAMQQDTLFAIDVGDGRVAGCSGDKARVISENAFLDKAADVNDVRADGP